jgi:hypothetical protein
MLSLCANGCSLPSGVQFQIDQQVQQLQEQVETAVTDYMTEILNESFAKFFIWLQENGYLNEQFDTDLSA